MQIVRFTCKTFHFFELEFFSWKGQEIAVESIVVTPNVFFSSESLEFFTMVHQVTHSVYSFSEYLEFFLEFL